MQLVLICKGLVTNILRAGAAGLPRSRGSCACWTIAAAVGNRNTVQGETLRAVWEGSPGMHLML